MKIDSASFSLQASHVSYTRDESRESMRTWRGQQSDSTARNATSRDVKSLSERTDSLLQQVSATLSISAAARASMVADAQAKAASLGAGSSAAVSKAGDDSFEGDPVVQMIKSMIETITGRDIKIFSSEDIPPLKNSPAMISSAQPTQRPLQTGGNGPNMNVAYERQSLHEEFEQTQIAAEGVIKTSDGQEISFKLELDMTRYQREETSESIRSDNAPPPRKDPLVLNFDGLAAQLSDRRIEFDLLGNGQKEAMALLSGGSAYLALDRNKNGQIDSGLELFGPKSNSGFSELAALDDDNNGWIDENDAAYASLKLWTPDENGKGKLETLKDRDVGAIAVGHIASPFELRGKNNSNLGAVAATGLYLTENGKAGSVQEINLTV